ncbi:MAG: hypothetical protein IJY66_06740 [Clostridia bacterium]|nr:hypothetical protein [Clostridia bacterium]
MTHRNMEKAKLLRFLLTAALLLSLVSCRQGADATPQKPLQLYYRDVAIGVGMEIEPLLTALGEDYTVAEAQSCAGIGRDMVYTYPSLRLYAFEPVSGVARLTSAVYTDDGAEILGIRIGSMATDVIEALGEPAEQSEQKIAYCDDVSTLTFSLREGRVSAIVLSEIE